MASLRDQFEHFYPLRDDTVQAGIERGMVTPDTNVLLSLYRFQASARDELFGALEKLGGRLWIPHQVGLEFHRRRLDVIADQEKYFDNTQRELDALIKDLRKNVDSFGARIAMQEDRVRPLKEGISSLQQQLTAAVNDTKKANDVHLRDRDCDAVLDRLESLLDDRVGEPMEPEAFRLACEEALRRVEAKLPPGYRDGSKADPTGDYLIFRQLMDEARSRKLPVVFISDDEKPDWYRREHGIPLGARAELRDEMMTEAGVPFVMMPSATFLRLAKEYLHAAVSQETVDQAEELPGIIEGRFLIEAAAMVLRSAAYAPAVGHLYRDSDDRPGIIRSALPDESRAASLGQMLGFVSPRMSQHDQAVVIARLANALQAKASILPDINWDGTQQG